MKTFDGAEIELLTLALDVAEQSASRPGQFVPGELSSVSTG
jgi:hypothetical protein